jgi:hypothetical protein
MPEIVQPRLIAGTVLTDDARNAAQPLKCLLRNLLRNGFAFLVCKELKSRHFVLPMISQMVAPKNPEQIWANRNHSPAIETIAADG